MKNKKVVWFAKGGGIARCGPYKSQIEAANAMRLAPLKDPAKQNCIFPDNTFVWPEYEEK
jgi:hypothetical protein